ncbi:DUF748 domain-containing protein [Echinicola sp. 20G]|uniref:DUF748 domain-containing protein n=1 Tax=Echinicola sp. 20G TaxID=2781961 RepID=UPI001910EB85|nr:DUF748 domain-containing protein [Echinicola sp. 20G]
MKKILLIISVVIFSVYLMLYISPYFIKNYFNKHSEELIGRKAFLEKLSFNPFNGKVHSENFTVYEQEDSTQFSGFASLDININFLKMVTGNFQFEEVALDSPYVHVVNRTGNFNFDDLLVSENSEEEGEGESTIAFEILNFRMDKGIVTYYETEIDHEVVMDDLSLELPRFAYNSESANMDIKLVINKTGQLTVKNDYYPSQNKLDARLSLRGLKLDIIKPYLSDYMVSEDFEGVSGGDVRIIGSFAEETNVNIDGKAWVTQLTVKDTAQSPVFEADSIMVSLKNIDVFKERYEVGRVYAENFKMRFDMLDSTNNMMVMFAPMLEEGETESASNDTVPKQVNETEYYYSIDTFLVVNSSMKYRDYALDEYFEYNITEIAALADNIRSDSQEAKLSSTGVLNVQGNYNANLIFDPNKPLDFSLDFVVKGFQMEDLSPFSMTYAGHPIFEGNLVYSGKTTVKDGIMDSENKITVYDLEVGKRVSKNVLYVLPLKFGVFLLKDKNGVVNLDLPMEGNLYDPQFKVWPIVWQIIKQNLDKVVSAPGKLLANVFGMKEEDINYVGFEPLDSLVMEEQQKSLDNLIVLMDKKPGLLVELSYYEPDQIESMNLAMYKAKNKYLSEQLGINMEGNIKADERIADNDIHFINYMKGRLLLNNPELDSAQLVQSPDSLALEMIGMENVLPQAKLLGTARRENIIHYISTKDSTKTNKFSFVELEEIPKFPIDKSGFVVTFDVE